MDKGKAKFPFGEILGEALVLCVLRQAKVGKVVAYLEVQAKETGEPHVVLGRVGEQLHQADGEIEQAAYVHVEAFESNDVQCKGKNTRLSF